MAAFFFLLLLYTILNCFANLTWNLLFFLCLSCVKRGFLRTAEKKNSAPRMPSGNDGNTDYFMKDEHYIIGGGPPGPPCLGPLGPPGPRMFFEALLMLPNLQVSDKIT